jgi:pyruvate dehydrogenase complex dehydrogenase (E1) component
MVMTTEIEQVKSTMRWNAAVVVMMRDEKKASVGGMACVCFEPNISHAPIYE